MTNMGRILIADDEETFLYSTADLLRRKGYECDCAPDASIAAQMLCSDSYDLLIADIMMPGNPQLELIRELPRIAEGMPVILATGYPSLESAIQSINLPVVAYMVKPVDFDQLLSQVQVSIEGLRVRQAMRRILQRLHNWHDELARVEEALNSVPRCASSTLTDVFLELTYANLVGTLSDLKYLTESFAMHRTEQEACHLFNCPKLTSLTNVLMGTIEVLEKTKSSFKSKELGELRRKLEGVVKSLGQNEKMLPAQEV